ncbi:recombinase family protein, partial [Aurantimonas sp. C2-6-R+9]|uniref:recombinase zinc beta ribbon domain-containing protein n=1 Tax=Aurantimonas sp. C2-6-R+9 TaxID=3114365 RepID=UPI002E17FBE9|nr:recombinase family protein [Aurantimonas sp. C2-6-R+9]
DGGRWGIGQVHRILTRRTYMGEHEFNKRSKSKELKPASEIVTVPVPPIIDRETFDAVQARLRARNPKVMPARVISGPTMLTGLIHCAKCGGAMTIRTGKGGRYRYYACSMKARQGPTACEGIRRVIDVMPRETETERRDRALIAFTLLTGARDNAIASMSLKHVDLEAKKVFQDARDVRTKNRKTFTTCFFPVGKAVEAVVAGWIEWLRNEKGWRQDDPLFPATKVALGESGGFENAGLDRKHWKDAAAIRRIFRQAFERAGLPYANPHSVRNTLVALGQQRCISAEDFKAWSQNLGHEKVLTTFTSYGAVASHKQAEIFERFRTCPSPQRSETLPEDAILDRLLERLHERASQTP